MAAVVVTSTKHGQQQISDHGVMDFSGMSLIKLKKEEMEAQVKVLQLESQLEQERVRLGELRKRHYDIRGPENGPEPDDGAESFPPPPPPTLLDSTPIPPSFSQTQPYVHTQRLAQTNPFAPAFSLSQSYTPTQTYTPPQTFTPPQAYVPPQPYTPGSSSQSYNHSQAYSMPPTSSFPSSLPQSKPAAQPQTSQQSTTESSRTTPRRPNIFTKSGNLLKNAFKRGETGTGTGES